ncbi:MAG TPA: class I SAM-dependent methyltransferase, partial [Chitinophagaceae bacterium]
MSSGDHSQRCLFCGSEKIAPTAFPRPTFFNAKSFHYLECRSCNLVFIDPIPSDDDYAKMYALDYHDQFYFKQPNDSYRVLYELLESFRPRRSLIDFGCGDGSFLHYLKGREYVCAGVEFNEKLVLRLRDMYADISFSTVDGFPSMASTVKPGVIYMGDVLEHLSKPYEILQSLYTNLEPGGMLLVQGPLENNTHLALAFRKFISRMKGRSQATHVPYHISFSNADNQREVFERAGFQTLYYHLHETPWPMPARFSLSPVRALQWAVAKVSIFVSRLRAQNMGNRFIYIGRKG